MDLQNLSSVKTALYLSIIYVIVTTSVKEALSVDSKYEDCVPRNCGKGPNISYPFWILDQHESYCGYPNFVVKCKDDHPVIKISNDDYIIRDVFYANNSFSLENVAVFANETCPTPLHNFSLDHTPFGYSPSYIDLNFFYNCTMKPTGYYSYPVQCATNTTVHSFAVFHMDALEATGFPTNSCQSLVNAPVDIDEIKFKSLIDMNYTQILKTGFHLNWASSNCSNCERSGGHCGFEENEFLCFCIDRPRNLTCTDGRKGHNNLGLRLGIGFGAAGGSIVLMLVIFCIYQRRNKKKFVATSYVSRNMSSDHSSMDDIEKMGSAFGLNIFTYSELVEATNNFDASKELGDGGFGTVYYGKLKDGRTVAVKRLYENNIKRVEQFLNEVGILTRLRHKNLVLLYGCTSRHSQELLLVYEYIPNGTVADHLHGDKVKPGCSLPWAMRLKIAIETASALAYLHASDVIHRDVKSNNILLDNNFCVKVADFGLSRLFPTDVTHVSTAPQGTPGYVDPDYHQCYQLTDKSDVYSFGVVMIELISSKPAVDITRHRHEINLSNMAINKIQNGQVHELVDLSLGYESDRNIHKMMNAVAELAFRCLQSDKDLRPTMEEVLNTLTDILSDAQNAVKPKDVHVLADEDVLLKNGNLALSPDSVTVKWTSTYTTPNTSG